eukprot:4178972-Prymnesium_polylepis.2
MHMRMCKKVLCLWYLRPRPVICGGSATATNDKNSTYCVNFETKVSRFFDGRSVSPAKQGFYRKK